MYPSQHCFLLPWYIPVIAYCCSSICLSARDKEGSVTSEQCCWSQPYGTWKPPMTLSTSLSTSTPSTDTCPTISREYWGSKLLHVLIKITCKVQSCARNSILWICVSIKLSASQLVKFRLVHAIPGMKWLSGLLPNSFCCSIFLDCSQYTVNKHLSNNLKGVLSRGIHYLSNAHRQIPVLSYSLCYKNWTVGQTWVHNWVIKLYVICYNRNIPW